MSNPQYMGRHLKPLPPELPHVFSRSEARVLRVGHSRLRRSDVMRIAPGFYARVSTYAHAFEAAPDTPYAPSAGRIHPAEAWRQDQRERASLLANRLTPGQFFTHHTAAALWHLPVPARTDARLDIGYLLPARGSRSAEVRSHRFKAGSIDLTLKDGIPLLSAASTWVALAPLLPRMQAIALGDAVIHTPRMPGTNRLLRDALGTAREIEHLLEMPYRRDRARLSSLLQELSPHAASPPESHLRVMLSNWGFPAPELDFDVRDQRECLLGCSEFAYPGLRLALEYEGDHHRTEAKQWERDIAKYRDYRAAGWEVLRVTRGMLYREPDTLLRELTKAFDRAHLAN